jgi:NAD(P)-dependent dehydrogenase (short-subunit alcohol dehydrogenase family)
VVSLARTPADEPLDGVRYVRADVSSENDVEAAFDDIDRVEGQIDILVNNAAAQKVGVIGKLPLDEWNTVIASNLTGAFLTCSQAIPRMARRGQGGAIVNIASTAAFLGLPGRGPYCAAKAGMLGLTRTLALEGATLGIRVNAVAPGFTRTDMITAGVSAGRLTTDWMMARVPMGRLAEPTEIAEVVATVAGPSFSFVTGQTILVDGGWSVQGISDAPVSLQNWRDDES